MQMVTTGWISEEPEQAPVGGFAGFILANRAAPGAGRSLGQVFARAAQARDREPEPVDPDDRMAAMVTRGYRPGALRSLSEQLGDVQAELEEEQAKLERGARRQEIAAREHAAGRADVWQMQRMLDGDFGDQATVELLERRADGLRRQIAEAQAAITPPERRAPDPLEAAASRAHAAFAEVTRARMAEAEARRPGPRPFASVSRGAGRGTEHTGPDCWVCAEARRRDAERDRADYAAVYGEIAR
jgi:hypothetical protein